MRRWPGVERPGPGEAPRFLSSENVNPRLTGLIEREQQPARHDAAALLPQVLEARVGWRILAVRRLGRVTLARFRLKIAMHLLLVADGIYFQVERRADGLILLGIDAAQ